MYSYSSKGYDMIFLKIGVGKQQQSISIFASFCRKSMVPAEFERLEKAEDYEQLIRKSVRGVPSHWPAEIAKQCVFSPTSSNGKRCSLLGTSEKCIVLAGLGCCFSG